MASGDYDMAEAFNEHIVFYFFDFVCKFLKGTHLEHNYSKPVKLQLNFEVGSAEQ